MNLQIADLFCGAGGTSTGIMQAVAAMANQWTPATRPNDELCDGGPQGVKPSETRTRHSQQ